MARRGGSEWVIRTATEPMPGYLALPAAGRGPGVLVLHEAWGLVDHIRDVCDRLARHGFVALAPDLYRGRTADETESAVALAGELDPARVPADLEASVTALLGQEAADGPSVGAVGFGLGGQLALAAAAASPRVAAVVDFYGASAGFPVALGEIRAPVLGIFAERDEWIPRADVEKLGRELEAAGVRATLRVEPGVQHAFMNDARPDRYDAVAAAAGWDRMLAFLHAELG